MKNTEEKKYQLSLLERLKNNPQDVEALVYLGALEFEFFSNDEQAISLLEKAVQLDPLNVDAKFWLAMCLYYDCFEYEKAKNILKEALFLDPNRPDCLSLMAWIIRENGDSLNEAIAYVQKALKYAPDWPMLHYQLSKLLFLIGKIEDSEKEVQKAFKIHPIFPLINNEVERYYESIVTGRSWIDIKNEFKDLLKDIQNAKSIPTYPKIIIKEIGNILATKSHARRKNYSYGSLKEATEDYLHDRNIIDYDRDLVDDVLKNPQKYGISDPQHKLIVKFFEILDKYEDAKAFWDEVEVAGKEVFKVFNYQQ